ncbi:MAG: hypothetical protein V7637_6435 [Mycobacteriales bacterium]
MSAVLSYLPRGNTLSDEAWSRRHLLLQWLLLLHIPGLFIFGLARGYDVQEVSATVAVPFALLIVARLMHTRRLASFFVTAGLFTCSAALVGLSGGAIEAHFHFFIMIGFIALYQDWIPFLANIIFTVLSHGFGSAFKSGLMFNHSDAIAHPWRWSLLHGLAVLAASIGVVLFWKTTEDEQQKTMQLREQLANNEISRRRFTSDMLVNLARRNQNLLYRQLDLLNQLEEHEQDADALADLFQLDHLATRIRRNAENLLVLSGEEPARKWGRPVPLADVVRAAIAETEDLDRVDFAVDESLAVSGRVVADLTHLLAEIIENAVHFSPPAMSVMLRSRTYQQSAGAQVLSIEDWGVGISPEEMAEANELLAHPPEVDLAVSQRLGLHVVARLARRYRISVSLTATPGGGVTAVVVLPPELFDLREEEPDFLARRPVMPVAPPSRQTAVLESAPPAPPVEATRTVTFAPPRPAIAAPSAVPVPRNPAPFATPEPFASAAGISDDWHSWWTPQEKANGHPEQAPHADYTAPRPPLTGTRAGHLDDLRPNQPTPPDDLRGRPPLDPSGPGSRRDPLTDPRPTAPRPGMDDYRGTPAWPGRDEARPGPTRPAADDYRPGPARPGPDAPGALPPRPLRDDHRSGPTRPGLDDYRPGIATGPGQDSGSGSSGQDRSPFRSDQPDDRRVGPAGQRPEESTRAPSPARRWTPEPLGSAGGGLPRRPADRAVPDAPSRPVEGRPVEGRPDPGRTDLSQPAPGRTDPARSEWSDAHRTPPAARPEPAGPDRARTDSPSGNAAAGRYLDRPHFADQGHPGPGAGPDPARPDPAGPTPAEAARSDLAGRDRIGPSSTQPPARPEPARSDLAGRTPAQPDTGRPYLSDPTSTGPTLGGRGSTAPEAGRPEAGRPDAGRGDASRGRADRPAPDTASGRPTPGTDGRPATAGGEATPAGAATRGEAPDVAESDRPRLSRRVPLANLAEGLRRPDESSGSEPQPIRDPEQAREALSRFQASQRAARAMLDGIDERHHESGGDSHS